MSQNFIDCDREQELLLPPSLRDWLPDDHLAWFVLDAVDELDLSAFFAAYRKDGWGRAAFDPQTMVALLLSAYAVGERSSLVSRASRTGRSSRSRSIPGTRRRTYERGVRARRESHPATSRRPSGALGNHNNSAARGVRAEK